MTVQMQERVRTVVESGNAILFLGAEASYSALIDSSPAHIYADTLRDRLCDEFLGGEHKKRNLTTVADYARNEASLVEIQAFVRNIFLPLAPAALHLNIPKFRWRAIVSTNYDLVVERAYANCRRPLQKLAPVTKDGEQLDMALAEENAVPYLKLHGCITNYADTAVPIVLDSHEYAKFEHGRKNLARTFSEWARKSPIILCSCNLDQKNIKQHCSALELLARYHSPVCES